MIAAVICVAQSQRAARRSRRRRPPRTMRPATAKIRSRGRLGSQRRPGPEQGKHLHPGQQFARQRGELAPDLVLLIAVQRQVAQAGVLRVADPVLAPGPAPVP